MSDTSLPVILHKGTNADRLAFTPDPASSGLLYLWYVTDAAPFIYAWNGSAWVLLNAADTGMTQLTGDVTAGPGSGSQAATIANDAVTYAKMQNISAASRLLGRGSASGSGDTQEITLGTSLSMSGTTLNASGGATVVRKTADESVTSSTTFQDDDALTLSVLNGEVWVIEFWLFVISASSTPQFKYRLSVPGGSTIKAAQDNVLFSTASQSGSIDRFSNASGSEPATYIASTGSGGFAQLVRFPCVVIAGGNGNITLQWAQNVSNGNATTVQANSVMICNKAS